VEKKKTDVFYISEEFQKLSDEDQALVARYLWANMAAINDLLNPLEPFGRRDIIQLQKASLLSCTGHIIRLGSFTAATGYLGLGVVAVGSAVTGRPRQWRSRPVVCSFQPLRSSQRKKPA
jgi:hypothetical protein